MMIFIDTKKLANLKKKNDLVRKLLYIFIITACFVTCITLLVNREMFPFISLILFASSIILYLCSKKINIDIKKMCDEVIGNQ